MSSAASANQPRNRAKTPIGLTDHAQYVDILDMDIPPLPAKRLIRPFLLNFLLIAVLAVICIAAGSLLRTMLVRDQLVEDGTRAAMDILLGSAAPSAYPGQSGLIPLHQLDPAGRLGRDYRIFSQTPLNPANLPDDTERQALLQFQKGATEFKAHSIKDGASWYTYARPLTVDQSCLRCHADQGYAEGQLRGGIALSRDVTANERINGLQFFSLLLLVVAALVLGGVIPVLMRRHFLKTINHMEARLAEMASTDELTGLANRRHFFNRFDEEVARAVRHGRGLGIIMIDIDHFKLVNDFYGHQVGDQALQILAGQLKGNCRVSDLVARYGGEEFIILLPEVDRAGAQVLAEKLRGLVAASSVRLNPQQLGDKPGSGAMIPESARLDPTSLRFTISLGVACVDGPALKELQPANRLVALADAALYKAKHTGRNRVMVY